MGGVLRQPMVNKGRTSCKGKVQMKEKVQMRSTDEKEKVQKEKVQM